MGRSGQMTGWDYDDPSMTTNTAVWGSGGIGSIWMLGYDPERWKMVPDPKTLSTVIRGGNFDYLTNEVVWTSSLQAQTLPASLYLSAKPGFFGNYQWPWVIRPAAPSCIRCPLKPGLMQARPSPWRRSYTVRPRRGWLGQGAEGIYAAAERECVSIRRPAAQLFLLAQSDPQRVVRPRLHADQVGFVEVGARWQSASIAPAVVDFVRGWH